jgi:hypothetical protein
MDDQQSLHRRLESFLQEQGHVVEVVEFENGHQYQVKFRSRGVEFKVLVNAHDPSFFYLYHRMPIPAHIVNGLRCAEFLSDLMARHRVVKVWANWKRRKLTVAVEQFLAHGSFEPIFWDCVEEITDAAGIIEDVFQRWDVTDVASEFIAEMESRFSPQGQIED